MNGEVEAIPSWMQDVVRQGEEQDKTSHQKWAEQYQKDKNGKLDEKDERLDEERVRRDQNGDKSKLSEEEINKILAEWGSSGEQEVSEEEIDNILEEHKANNDIRSRVKVENGDNHIEANAQEAVETQSNEHSKNNSKDAQEHPNDYDDFIFDSHE